MDGNAVSTTPGWHVHDCANKDLTCWCGFKFAVARFCVVISVHDNDTGRDLIEEGIGYSSARDVAALFRRLAAEIEEVA